MHALSGIQIHDLSVQAIKADASDRADTGTSSSTVGPLRSDEDFSNRENRIVIIYTKAP
jgi:hypothetical protein